MINAGWSSMWLKPLLQTMIFAGLLSIAFLEQDYFYFAWVAFVPMLFALENASLLKTYLLGLIAGIVAYTSGMYWIVDFIQISKGFEFPKSLGLALIYWVYCGHLMAFMFLLFKWIKCKTNIHEFIIFPIVVVTFTSAYPMLFAMRLGDSQTSFLIALQAIEFVGVHGLDAIVALVNIVIFRLVRTWLFSRKTSLRLSIGAQLMAFSVIALWFGYGVIQLSSWSKQIAQWDTVRIGIVQPNEIPRVGKRTLYPGYSMAYPPEMEMTERLSSLGAEIIVWPEAQAKEYLDNVNVKKAFQSHMKSMGSSLIFQDIKRIRDPMSGKIKNQFSAAMMLNEQGEQTGLYQKIKRIPFGEYLPLVSDDSAIKKGLKRFFGEFFVELSAGTEHHVFRHEKLNVVPMICYETTFPSFVATAVNSAVDDVDKSLATIMVALTNDGWFGSTHQPYEHIFPSILRSVENRLPLVHVANNGPSIVVMPSGNVIFTSDFQQAGGYIVDLPSSPTAQGSFFSRHPRLFDRSVYSAMTLMILLGLLTSWQSRTGSRKRREK